MPEVSSQLIAAYVPNVFPLTPNNKVSGYFPESKKIKPFKVYGGVHEVLDAIAAAAEAGMVDRSKWVKQFFATQKLFREFMEELSEYDVCYRIVDQWYRALFKIADLYDEEGFVTSEEIVEKLLQQAEESGQIKA